MFEWQAYTDFAGGINNVQDAHHIADNEFVELLNFEFSSSHHIKSRGGFERYNISPDFTSRITSIYNFITAAQVNNIIVTTADNVYKDTAGNFSSIKGALTLPSNTYWRWTTFNDLAIGVNGDIGAVSDIVKWTGGGNIADLALTGISGAPVGAFTIESFNNRLWVVFKNLPNRLYYSTLGNPEDWSTSGGFIEIGYNDNDIIVGIFAHRERLFIFKRRSIHVLRTGINGQINTDPAGWSVNLLTRGSGCVSQHTIRPLLNDLVFLSEEGMISINAVQEYGEFSVSAISRKVTGLSNNLNLAIDTFSSAVLTNRSMLFIAVPSTKAGTVNDIIYVADYKNIQGGLRWTTFKSEVVKAATLAVITILGEKTLFVGGDSTQPQIFKYNPDIYNDHNNVAIMKKFVHKSFNFDLPIERKELNHVGIGLEFSEEMLKASWRVRIDKKNSVSIPIDEDSVILGGVWGSAIWDIDTFSAGTTSEQLLVRKLKDAVGRRGREFQHIFECNQLSQNIILHTLGFEVDKLTSEQS